MCTVFSQQVLVQVHFNSVLSNVRFNAVPFLSAADTPAQRVQFLLGTEDGDEEHMPHALFTELDEICLREGEDAEWKETARYPQCSVHCCSFVRRSWEGIQIFTMAKHLATPLFH